jgi:hypothetical protein
VVKGKIVIIIGSMIIHAIFEQILVDNISRFYIYNQLAIRCFQQVNYYPLSIHSTSISP